MQQTLSPYSVHINGWDMAYAFAKQQCTDPAQDWRSHFILLLLEHARRSIWLPGFVNAVSFNRIPGIFLSFRFSVQWKMRCRSPGLVLVEFCTGSLATSPLFVAALASTGEDRFAHFIGAGKKPRTISAKPIFAYLARASMQAYKRYHETVKKTVLPKETIVGFGSDRGLGTLYKFLEWNDDKDWPFHHVAYPYMIDRKLIMVLSEMAYAITVA